MEKSVGVQVPLYPRFRPVRNGMSRRACYEAGTGSSTVHTSRKVLQVQVTITSVSDVEQEADIQIPQDELQPMFEQAYAKYRSKVELKGFRKGKVPMPMIKQLYGEAIERESLDDIASDFYRRAMEEKGVHPVGQPTMVDMDFKRGEHFNFKIKYEVKPAVTLGNYRGLAIEKPIHIVTDAEVEAEIAKIRRANSAMAEAERVTDTGYVVTADVQELDESGAPLIGKKTPGGRFDLSDETLAPAICEALAAAVPGGTYTARFDSQHDDHTHPVHISLAVTKVEKITLPPLDEELVKKITGGKVDTVDQFRKNLRSDIERFWEDESNGRVNDNIARSLVDAHQFTVPDSIVNGLLDSYVDDVRNRSRDRKLPRGFDEQKFREENRASAVWQARWIMLKEKIAEQEKITVAPEEIEAMAEREAGKIGIDKERLLQYYRKSSSAEDRLLSDKIMAFLRSSAKITEKIINETPQNA